MFDERAFIRRVEGAGAAEFARMLGRPSAEEEQALRAYFGDGRYQRLRNRALAGVRTRGAQVAPKGNVVVIHGIAGGELISVERSGDRDHVWVNPFRIMAGVLERLRLQDDGETDADQDYTILANGVLKRYYGELLLALGANWNVEAFAYDWRKSLDLAADELNARINSRFGETAPVHIVAHSMGGLVARTFIKRFPARWNVLWDAPSGARGGRLIMLGTPNHGSFAIPQLLTGIEALVTNLAVLDFCHDRDGLRDIFNTFVGSYQMLPSPLVMPTMAPLYDAHTYGAVRVSPAHLANARKHHQWLADVVDPKRMIYVAGYNQPTWSNVTDMAKLASEEGYECSYAGDGRVPHVLGLLTAKGGARVPTYFVEEVHGSLQENDLVIEALEQLLEQGNTDKLLSTLPARRGGETKADKERARVALRQLEQERGARFEALLAPMATRGAVTREPEVVTAVERDIQDALTEGLLGGRSKEPEQAAPPAAPPSAAARAAGRRRKAAHASMELTVVCGRIDEIHLRKPDSISVDAIAVGHYRNVLPEASEKALDRALNTSFDGDGTDTLLRQFTLRGILRGDLGQPFLLPDPRPTALRKRNGKGKGRAAEEVQRVIAIAGLGVPGRGGMPEVGVAVRELAWTLGRIGKRHLASVLIGSGNGNLAAGDALTAWLHGLAQALTAVEREGQRLQRITFVEFDPGKALELDLALAKACATQSVEEESGVTFAHRPLPQAERAKLARQAREWAQAELKRAQQEPASTERAPTRVVLELDPSKGYRFGAITATAAVPERTVAIDPSLVASANDELAAESHPGKQKERGRFLERLLLPADLRDHFTGDAPLVLVLDATTARIHWEMAAQPDPLESIAGATAEADLDAKRYDTFFLGTCRGLTRQLRTAFAPVPEPPPPPRRRLRVLVVADPAEDAPLPGAQAEGQAVVELFERFNTLWSEDSDNQVAVTALLGPSQATRTNVLRELMLRRYDVLHYAGHCAYDAENPVNSGWIFTAGKRLTANELNRLDRVPPFVFSNACESGVTPDRVEKRSAALAPTFAEAFFARGVSNFVCTAWPVDDVAALEFALALYGRLLGIERVGKQENAFVRSQDLTTMVMYQAMRGARLAIATAPYGLCSWGAYQHYGDPHMRLFQPASMAVPPQPGKGKRQRR